MRFAVAHPADDRLLGAMPLVLLPLVRVPVEAVVVGGVCVSSWRYWNDKNTATWQLDVAFACAFLALSLHQLPWTEWGRVNTGIVACAVGAVMVGFYVRSHERGERGERQVWAHAGFRAAAACLFLLGRGRWRLLLRAVRPSDTDTVL